MARHERVRGVAVAAALVLVALAAAAVPPDSHWVGRVPTVLGPMASWALGAGVVLTLVVLLGAGVLLWRQRRRDVGDAGESTPSLTGSRGQRVFMLAAVLGVLVCAAAVLVALVHVVDPASAPAPSPGHSVGSGSYPGTAPSRVPHRVQVEGSPGLRALVVGAVLVLLTVLGFRIAMRHPGQVSVSDAEQGRAAVEQAVLAADAALVDVGEPRVVVLACYAALEGELSRAGVSRRPSDTPAELLARVGLTSPEARELAELFREARYSQHVIGPDHVRRARSALTRLRLDLGVAPS